MAAIPTDLLDRIRRLEDEVRQLRGRAQIRPAMNQVLAGDVTIGEGGALRVEDIDGSGLLLIGRILPDHPGGAEQRGMIMWRETGEIAMAMFTASPDPQDVVLYDIAGNHVIKTGSVGLKKPWFPVPLYPPNSAWASWPSTASTSMEILAAGEVAKTGPRIRVAAVANTDGGTSGSAQVYIGGSPVGSPVAVTGGAVWVLATADLPGAHEEVVQVEVRARVTSGSGSVFLRPHSCWVGGDM